MIKRIIAIFAATLAAMFLATPAMACVSGCTTMTPMMTSGFNLNTGSASFGNSDSWSGFGANGTGWSESGSETSAKINVNALLTGGLLGPCTTDCAGNGGQIGIEASNFAFGRSLNALTNDGAGGSRSTSAWSGVKLEGGNVGQVNFTFMPMKTN